VGLKSRLVRGSLYTLFSSLGINAIALVTTVLYARLLSPDDFGVLGIFLALGATIAPFASLRLEVAVAKYTAEYAKTDPSRAERFLGVATSIALGFGGSLSIAYFVLAGPIAAFYQKPILADMVRLSASVLLLGTLVTILQAAVQGFQEIRKLAVLMVSAQSLAIPTIFIFVSQLGLVGAAVSSAVLAAANFALSLIVARSVLRRGGIRIRPARDRETTRRLGRFTLPMLLGMALNRPAWLVVATVITLWLTYREYALFRVASSLYRVVLVLPAVLSVPLLPAIAEAYATQPADRTRTQLTLLLRITTILALPLALLMGLGATVWLGVLYGPAYAGAGMILFVLSFAALLDTLGSICENTLIGTGRTWYVLGLNGLQVSVLVGGTIFLLPRLGVMGAAYATVLGALAYLAGAIIELSRRRDIDGRHLRDVGALVGAATTASAVLVAAIGLGNYVVAGLLLASVIVAGYLLLTPRDRTLLLSAARGVLGMEKRKVRP